MSQPHDPYQQQPSYGYSSGGEQQYGYGNESPQQYGSEHDQYGGQQGYGSEQQQYGYGSGEQQYDQQQYGQQQYGQQQYGYESGQQYGGYGSDQQPYGYGSGDQYGYGTPPPQKKNLVWLWALIAVVIIAAAGVGGYFVFRGDDKKKTNSAGGTEGRSITLPASFDGFTRLTSFPTDALKSQLGSQLAQFGVDQNSVVQHAQIGVYGKSGAGVPSVIFVSIALSDVPKLKDMVANQGIDSAVQQFVGGANNQLTSGQTPQVVSPGAKGGAMRCSAGGLNGQQVGFCGWGDQSVFAITIVVSASSPEAAATTTRDLREAAES